MLLDNMYKRMFNNLLREKAPVLLAQIPKASQMAEDLRGRYGTHNSLVQLAQDPETDSFITS